MLKSKVLVKYILTTISIDSGGYKYSDGTDWYAFNTMEEAEDKATRDFMTIRNSLQERLGCSEQEAERKIDDTLNEMLAD